MCALFTALIAVGAYIRIPGPAVPFTLQTLFVMLAGVLLGPRLGVISALAYMLIGLLGIPIFTGGGGIGYVFRLSFGYIIGFVAAAYVTGRITARSDEPSLRLILIANGAGIMTVYAFGLAYYYLLSRFYFGQEVPLVPFFMNCFILTLPGDIVTCGIGAVLSHRLIPVARRTLN